MNSQKSPKFVLLTILDGWGLAPDSKGNAIQRGNTPNIDHFMTTYPNTVLKASGEAVGLPRGEAGNTETGHLNIGAGRIVYQDLERINMSIAEGDFFINPVLLEAINHAKKNNSKLHFMGLVGAGGVHSNISHLFALIRLASIHKVKDLYIHIFTDGRDSPPVSSLSYINKVEEVIRKEGVGKIVSVMGRYYAMDRDLRWDRTKIAYKTLIEGSEKKFDSIEKAIRFSYDHNRTDEFIEPAVITDEGEIVGRISDNDSVIFFNYRIDRPRQLAKAFVVEEFSKSDVKDEFDPYMIKYGKKHHYALSEPEKPFERQKKLNNLFFATMTQYSKFLTDQGAVPVFPPELITNTLGEVVSNNNKKQLRITESEKERFVTFYFNGLREEPFKGDDALIVPSPNVSTYDKKPEMSSKEMTSKLINEINKNKYDLIVCNFPSPDMVAHTGNLKQTIKAVEVVDDCLGKLHKCVKENNGVMVVTADHGNAEEMISLETGNMVTEHSMNPVPFIVVDEKRKGNNMMSSSGILADIAPTVLSIMNIPTPSNMSGRNLLQYM